MPLTLGIAMADTSNPYDAVPYRSDPIPQSHPDRLATVATLFSLPAPPVDRCRVLELGCAAGGNVIPIACDIPGSEVVGIDYSAIQVADGQKLINALGVKNIDLRHASILDVDESYGRFDYIICHGVYSWVPPPVADKILDITAKLLTPDGVAYISYNTYPGWHMRGIVREMMRYHAMRFDSPVQRVKQARLILDFVAQHGGGQHGSSYTDFLRGEADLLRRLPDEYIYHEHLETDNSVVYFHEFVSRAQAKGLDFLGEARVGAMVAGNFSPEAQKSLRLIARDLIELEQFMDFLRDRTFRETLLHRAGRTPQYKLQADRVFPMFIAGHAKPKGKLDLRLGENISFESLSGWPISTPQPMLKAALTVLTEHWPRALAFDELLNLSQQFISSVMPAAVHDPGVRQKLATALLMVHTSSDLLELSVAPSRFTIHPSPTPRAADLPRIQASHAPAGAPAVAVTSRRHDLVHLPPADARLLQLLDGETPHAVLAEKMKQPEAEVAAGISRLARSALLIA